ncbi:precorrin-2 C(20)-methyltransferase [Flexivirga sp. ID2601S]|uniref:Precorrin-2 C(20)-methyltransferase n=1 Tax=Flexivirga aerilata TaxID=1656889 RepID=A0A849AM48_9MICO|nr:precorrin-2 C(20)-methyltransferase [Flexivirga aerilata]NNG40441.1 precorrin-2 C(20)-methyltransferase [Flexivirga aerilata]
MTVGRRTPSRSAEPGHLYGVGVGPGDPSLVTVAAAGLIGSADVVAYHRAAHKDSVALSIARDYLSDNVTHEALVYPVTTGSTDHPGGYHALLAEFYDDCAGRLAAHLSAGRSVVVLAEGDPLFFGSFMYVHDLLKPRFPVEVVPGVTSMAAATAAVGTGLCRHEDTLTVLPGTLPVRELADRLSATDAAVVMKLGRTFPNVLEAVRQAGLLDRAWYVERASSEHQRVRPILHVDPATVPYMSLVVVTGRDLRADAAGRAMTPTVSETPDPQPATAGAGTVHVLGLGPGPDDWVTPEAERILAQVRHVVGYRPYVERVAPREGLTRHFSGNTVEVDRGVAALDLARAGHDVAVVSGGDPGVFAMASAVLEAQETAASDDPSYAQVDVRVHPGVTAAHAAAARAGAPLGGDHALISLSDRLKPWEVIERRLRALAHADLTIAIYNPRSASRPDQLGRAREVLLEATDEDRIVVVGRHIGREQESVTVTTLGDFDPETVDMGCLVIVGSSSTVVSSSGAVWTPRSQS